MIWTFIIFIVAVSVATIAFPLFWNKLQFYQLPENSTQDYSQADSWLSALSDLEVDFSLGRMSKKEYQQQKKFSAAWLFEGRRKVRGIRRMTVNFRKSFFLKSKVIYS